MEEEIDIIELLRRVKEGIAPKEIEIEGRKYEFYENFTDIVCAYQTKAYDDWLEEEVVNLDTKIKILDKPIIEDIKINCDETKETFDIKTKLNEIIRHINNKEEKNNGRI